MHACGVPESRAPRERDDGTPRITYKKENVCSPTVADQNTSSESRAQAPQSVVFALAASLFCRVSFYILHMSTHPVVDRYVIRAAFSGSRRFLRAHRRESSKRHVRMLRRVPGRPLRTCARAVRTLSLSLMHTRFRARGPAF